MSQAQIELTENPEDKHPFRKKQQKAVEEGRRRKNES